MLVVCLNIQDRQIPRQKTVSSLFPTCEKHHHLSNEWMPLGGTHFPLNFVLFLWKIVAFEGSTWRPTVHPGNFIWLFERMLFVGKGRLKRGFSSRWQPFSDVWMCTFLTISIHFLQVYACKKAQYLGFLMKVAGNPATCHSLAMLPAVAPAVAPSMESSGRRTYRAKTQWTKTTKLHRK